ncbi:3,4-dihydroxy-2-butanone-4-phosphate synthase [Methanoculleus bourgensis]|jgi:3,4-dihydroxy 2-butanone 4-phosphate synthase|uniref:3,4-dihydroxy-2-butanone 4-phosphate synthase n=1 Tax=Methanoculleus bourgensis TaxID=83986 RepID=A0A8T7H4S8_9EURY|nr:3,4-dihydroxy-2-butanone-4-phosphate synthase [Methanoculleus bourgensis]MBT0732732.1 3,4-dihydroxy-2-butanone-4-phosphate synthase [Methanoculleus bourgensis]NQS78837.1 3,4-dihydroxy-2-butanone-4-phosphate synthase [Methanoculleus bourgensis]GLI47218.1 3,4-dihydroxy-2-butanone-4-phosphate synthase [Methanoculleus bourgensis]
MIDAAIEALAKGEFILLYDFDNRERETDFAIRSDAVTPAHIRQMRKDGGGIIGTSIHPDAARQLGLPFASDIMWDLAIVEHTGDIPYDRSNRSSFSLWVNHRETYTGITDRDRALTANRIAEQVKRSFDGEENTFAAHFRTPGHMPIFRAAEGLLDVRRGQTELSITLAVMAGITPAVTICEMLDDETGLALSRRDAQEYARHHGLTFVEGREVLERWDRVRESATVNAGTPAAVSIHD